MPYTTKSLSSNDADRSNGITLDSDLSLLCLNTSCLVSVSAAVNPLFLRSRSRLASAWKIWSLCCVNKVSSYEHQESNLTTMSWRGPEPWEEIIFQPENPSKCRDINNNINWSVIQRQWLQRVTMHVLRSHISSVSGNTMNYSFFTCCYLRESCCHTLLQNTSWSVDHTNQWPRDVSAAGTAEYPRQSRL